MTRELELNGKHNGDEPIICTLVMNSFDGGYGADEVDDACEPSADFCIPDLSEELQELYKDEIQSEKIYMLVEHCESLNYKDPDLARDEAWDWDNDYEEQRNAGKYNY